MDIELITNEVIKRLLDKIKQEQQQSSPIDGKKFLQSNGEIISIPGYEAICLNSVKNNNELLNFEFLVLKELTIDELSCTVNGLSINEKTDVLRQFLLNGKNVFVIEEGLEHRRYKDISNANYYKIFREYERQLMQFGVRIMSLVALERVLQNEAGQKSPMDRNRPELHDKQQRDLHESPCVYSTENKLITNETAIQLAKEPTVTLKVGTIITPSAKDVFRGNNTTIRFI